MPQGAWVAALVASHYQAGGIRSDAGSTACMRPSGCTILPVLEGNKEILVKIEAV